MTYFHMTYFLVTYILVVTQIPLVTSQSLSARLGAVAEGQEAGSYVGNIPSETNLLQRVPQSEKRFLKYEFLDTGSVGARLFSLR